MTFARFLGSLGLFCSLGAAAQINVGGMPYSLRAGIAADGVPTVMPVAIDVVAVNAEDQQRSAAHQLPLYGRVLPLNVTTATHGVWMELPNGDRVWRLRISSPGALATELFFEEFVLPNDAVMHIYDEDGEQVIGGFTAANNKESGIFSTNQLLGSSCVIEYHEPLAVVGAGSFRITGVGHAYRFVGAAAADACQVDVNCQPEGAGQTAQRDGVVRISVKAGGLLGWCTGSLVNNLNLDCKPYFLTADHCQRDASNVLASTTDLAAWKFYFKYQRSGCGTGTALTGSSVTGCQRRADSNDNGGTFGSDFALMEGDDPIPTNYNPYWYGWDANEVVPGSGTKCIHHPSGDEKKISTAGTVTSSNWWNGINNPFPTHWRVTWVATQNGWGVTEGGSSGSPLYNSSGHIVGTLTGGQSCCDVNGCNQFPSGPTLPDYYGKMSFHWQNNGGPSTDDLKNFLDPNNTGLKVMEGSYGPCGTLGLEEGVMAPSPVLAPNPAQDLVRITLPEALMGSERVELLDLSGRVVLARAISASTIIDLDVSGLGNGLYLVTTLKGTERSAGARLTVVH